MDVVRRRVAYGQGAIHTLPEIVEALGLSRLLLITGRRSFDASGASAILPRLEDKGTVSRWSDFSTNTKVDDLLTGLELARSFGPDGIIGIGGGSVLDMAKLVATFLGTVDTGEVTAAITGTIPTPGRDIGLLLAPTTSGSGSEATHFAVVYVGEEKYSVAHPTLRPDVAVIDPNLSMSASPHQRATSGMDAICHAIESSWAVGATAESRRYAHRSLRCLLSSIRHFVETPQPATARAMAVGSHLAGRAIDISKTTAAHALSYGITRRYGVSHGHAAALTLGAFIEEHATADPSRLHPSVEASAFAAAMESILRALGADSGAAAREQLRTLMNDIDLATRLSDITTPPSDAAADLAASVNVERLGNNPVRFTSDELEGIVHTAV